MGLKLGHLLGSQSGEVGAAGTQPGIYTRGDRAAEVAVRGSSKLSRVGAFLLPVAFAEDRGRSQGQVRGCGTRYRSGLCNGQRQSQTHTEGPQDLCWSLGDILLEVEAELVARAETKSLSQPGFCWRRDLTSATGPASQV